MFDYGPPPKIWLPPRPAIIRPAKDIVRANILPGWFPGMAAPSASVLTEITQVASATSSDSASVTGPAGIQEGDILVLLDTVWNNPGNPPASSVPTGFTSITTATLGGNVDSRMTSSLKIATGAEASASITGMTGTGGIAKVLLVFRGNTPVTTLSAQDVDQEATDGNPAADTVTSGSGTPPLIVFGCYSSATAVSPRTFTVGGSPAKDGEVQATGSDIDSWLAWKIYNASPANVVIDMDDEVIDNIIHDFYLEAA